MLVVGAGFGGIGAAIRLRQHGIDDIVVLERADEVGGTWRDNTYPGCACDIPSHLYSFSFAPNPAWTRSYPSQPEIQRYLLDVVDRFGVRPLIRFGAEVAVLVWDEADRSWTARTTDGRRFVADVVVSATGPLSRPAVPDLPGLDRFAGTVFHSAQWHHDHDLAGERVGVVGTGASAVQFVPKIAEEAAHVTVFQRTAPWVVPRDDRPAPAWRRRLYARKPFLQRLHRWRIWVRQELVGLNFVGPPKLAARVSAGIRELGAAHLEAAVPDPDLRAELTPHFAPGCKRLLLSNDWYPTLARDDVDLVTSPIVEVDPEGVRTADGVVHHLDTLVLGTGFAATEFLAPMRVVGRGGEELSARWRAGAATHLGVTVSGFPNLFLLAGPGTGLGHSSIVFMLEAQIRYLLGALDHLERTGDAAVDLRPDVQQASYDELQDRLQRTVWTTGCDSWYRSADGRVDTLWPGTTVEYWWRTRRFDPGSYQALPARFGEPATTG